ncbi:MAG: type IV pilus modification protein PilV [Hydrogenophaga sp.]
MNNIDDRQRACGFGMVEVMVTLLIIMIGLLGLAALQGKSLTTQMEAYQRAQAIVIAKEMVARISIDQQNADDYATAEHLGTGSDQESDCSLYAMPGKERSFCEWHNMLLGAAESLSGNTVGAMIGARGCVDYSAATTTTPERVLVTVAWQGLNPTAAPPDEVTCGEDDYGDERLRRVITIPMTLANLGTS